VRTLAIFSQVAPLELLMTHFAFRDAMRQKQTINTLKMRKLKVKRLCNLSKGTAGFGLGLWYFKKPVSSMKLLLLLIPCSQNLKPH
jgi:hypothetical protein